MRSGPSTLVTGRTLLAHRATPTASRCPRCTGRINQGDAGYRCDQCDWFGAVVEGIPVLLEDPRLAQVDHASDDHGHDSHKAAQVSHYDTALEADFEIDRPHGSPALYRFLLAEKFRRGPGSIGDGLRNATVLTVCGGSGMDGEAFARAGANVVSSDLSLEASSRALERMRRYQVPMSVVVADVEHLPYEDRSFDIVAVHDGLHHLADPYVGLDEMSRVARRWVVVSEPSTATATRIAIHLGLALERESAGNRVARLERSAVSRFLQDRGFAVRKAERYAMYYPHRPGAVFRMLSGVLIFGVVRVTWRVANSLIGRWGNKMIVVAERE